MCNIILINILFIFNIISCDCLEIFHENTKVTFHADAFADYFGYSVLLKETSCCYSNRSSCHIRSTNADEKERKPSNWVARLFVGAPKARSRTITSIYPGLVFSCPLNLESKNVTCIPLSMNGNNSSSLAIMDGMWFGAVMTWFPSGQLIICAPRWASHPKQCITMQGGCYVHDQRNGLTRLGELNTFDPPKINIYGICRRDSTFIYDIVQTGISATVTEANTLVVGAPGFHTWAGGFYEYKLQPNFNYRSDRLKISSTTKLFKHSKNNVYLGYSVDSGEFDSTGNTFYVVGVPNGNHTYGQVHIYHKYLGLKTLDGPHLGSYFGGSVLCVDVNGDGVVDLLVGAPSYVEKKELYDQGGVFIHLTETRNNDFTLREAGHVVGSGQSGARFGTVIAELGDVDGDGFVDIAIGAPWENEGKGAVYIYGGSPTGLKASYIQKIIAADSRSFGISISKGVDVDGNNCNDLAVGAYQSGVAYIYRCIRTVRVLTAIDIPDIMDLPQNVTNFTALFCVKAPVNRKWPYINIDLRAKITVDPVRNRAQITKDSEYNISITPGSNICKEKTIKVVPDADMSRPISIQFNLIPMELMQDDSSVFLINTTRLSDDSVLQAKLDIQVTSGCGEDLICIPSLTMSLEPLKDPFIPGSDDKLGFTIDVSNTGEPAYGATIHLQLPSSPKRLPSECILDVLNVTCKLPSPLYMEQLISWDIEMEPTSKGIVDKEMNIVAKLEDNYHKNSYIFKELKITVFPIANINISGKALPNRTIAVTRDTFNKKENITFSHYFEITNFGPSDLYALSATLAIADEVNLISPVEGCLMEYNKTECTWSLPANVTMIVALQLEFHIGMHNDYLEENTSVNITSEIELLLEDKNQSLSVTTILVLEPSPPLWPVIVGSIVGLVLLAAIVFGLYKCGFFARTSRDELKKLQEQNLPEASMPTSDESTCDLDGSTEDLLSEAPVGKGVM